MVEDDDVRKTLPILMFVVLTMACNAPLLAQLGTPTAIPSTAAQPTPTLAPTLAPSPLPATATVEVTVEATSKAATGPELDCKVLGQSIKNGTKFTARERFDMSWLVQNTGTATWEPGVVEFGYAGGTKMYQYQPVPLKHSSPPGDVTTLYADLLAPKTPNVYTTIWSLRRGDEYFCRVSVTIKVHL
jgi:hypothetical protein